VPANNSGFEASDNAGPDNAGPDNAGPGHTAGSIATTTDPPSGPSLDGPTDTGELGYLRQPTVAGREVAFVADDDLWHAPLGGGVAERLTAGLGEPSDPRLSPDGAWLAFSGADEHHREAWVLAATGGPARRLTYFGADARVRGWVSPTEVLVVSSAEAPFSRHRWAYAQPVDGGPARRLPYGPVGDVAFGPRGLVVVGRNTDDPARWKRYRGGTAGQLWIGGDGPWRPLIELDGNLASPNWVGERVFFLSDHEGIGNLYSCRPDGDDLRRHSDHDTYYARAATSDGETVVYQHAGRIWRYDPDLDAGVEIPLVVRPAAVQRRRRYVEAAHHLEAAALSPDGSTLAITTRGQLFSLPLFEEAAGPLGADPGVRRRLAHFVDPTTVVAVSDEGGEEALEEIDCEGRRRRRLLTGDLGEVVSLVPAPSGRRLAVTNRRGELFSVTLPPPLDSPTLGDPTSKESEVEPGRAGQPVEGTPAEVRLVDRSDFGEITNPAWAPDGRWLAYATPTSRRTQAIKLADVDGESRALVSTPEFRDHSPVFARDGRWLAFLSYRSLDPVHDEVYFDAAFLRASRPYLVPLRQDDRHPLRPRPRGMKKEERGDETEESATRPGSGAGESAGESGGESQGKSERPAGGAPIRVDLEGISERIVPVDVPAGTYVGLFARPDALLLRSVPIRGSLGEDLLEEEASGQLHSYHLDSHEHEILVDGVDDVVLSADGSTLVYRAGERLRALPAGQKPPEGKEHDAPSRASGWIDLGRIRVAVDPGAEWRQMLVETWRLQRNHFWVDDMSGVDWDRVLTRYLPLVAKITTRGELTDLIWELQGELGTSHAYEFGGDHRRPPAWRAGHLGADFSFDPERDAWVVSRVLVGDSWSPAARGPLAEPGVAVRAGSVLRRIDATTLSRTTPPGAALVHRAGVAVEVEVEEPGGQRRRVVATPIGDERPVRYREWVNRTRAEVHARSDGRLGYLHIPDMGPAGYAEFHRSYLAEVERDGLIVDVRHNGGGNVSSLLLAKLAGRRLGVDVSRWLPPTPYPEDAPGGPLVAIADCWAGSDGDIFTHAFQLLGLGPVVGTRTWGGVIGIWPRVRLVDGTVTTQPEFSYWFRDLGWSVENRGVDPDVPVEITPDDWAAGRDPQLERAIELAMAALDRSERLTPDLAHRPRLSLPTLPPRAAGQGSPAGA